MPIGGRSVLFGDKCKDCGTILTEYNGVIKGPYLQSRCKSCHKIRVDNSNSRTYESRAAQYISWKFGISIEEYRKKLELQLGGCAICKQPCPVRKRLAVDHNHETNEIRDLLCHRCNMVLGLVNEDDLLLSYLIDYIKKHNKKIA